MLMIMAMSKRLVNYLPNLTDKRLEVGKLKYGDKIVILLPNAPFIDITYMVRLGCACSIGISVHRMDAYIRGLLCTFLIIRLSLMNSSLIDLR